MSLGEIQAHSAYVLSPEEGPFRPLLAAPTHYDAKDPVWRYGDNFGAARKPYCFAGVRTNPIWTALFACDMFSDTCFETGDNLALLDAVIDEVIQHCLGRPLTPANPSNS